MAHRAVIYIRMLSEARLEAAATNVTAAEAAIELYELCAPFNGVLLSLDLTAGEAALPVMSLFKQP